MTDTTLPILDSLEIREYNLFDFSKAIEQAVLLGYEIMDSNEAVPKQIGHLYHAIMYRPMIEELLSEEDELKAVQSALNSVIIDAQAAEDAAQQVKQTRKPVKKVVN